MVRFVPVMAAAAALAACDGAAEPGAPAADPPAATTTATGDASPAAAPAPAPSASETPGGARAVTEETDDYLFEYSYPEQVGRIPELAALLDRRMEERRAELARTSARARRDARSDGFPYNKHSYSAEWKVVAAVPGWLSLSNAFNTYTGGAHGNYGLESLVWNREQARAMPAIELFTSPAALEEALGDRFCDALDNQRAARREDWVRPEDRDDAYRDGEGEGEGAGEGEGEGKPARGLFDNCPAIGELTVVVGSSSGRAFNRLTLYAGPYVAGPYVEGAYEVDLPVDRAVRQAVRPEYRGSFASRN